MADVRPDWSLQGFGELMVHVALFMLSGPTLILLQKYVLGILNFEYPIFIVTLAALARWLLILTLVHTGVLKLGKHGDMTFLQWTRACSPWASSSASRSRRGAPRTCTSPCRSCRCSRRSSPWF